MSRLLFVAFDSLGNQIVIEAIEITGARTAAIEVTGARTPDVEITGSRTKEIR